MSNLENFYSRLNDLDSNIKRVEIDLCYLEKRGKESVSYKAKWDYYKKILKQRDNLK
jgi:hypothetical protein